MNGTNNHISCVELQATAQPGKIEIGHIVCIVNPIVYTILHIQDTDVQIVCLSVQFP